MAVVENLGKLLGKLKKKAGLVGPPKTAVVVGYTAAYGVFVHEDLEAFHPVGRAKFLEEPFRRLRPDLRRIIAAAYRRGVPVEKCLLLAGLQLQRESQLLVPVDTGALKASAFTKVDRGGGK
ncbi:MAG: hypothetical protein ACRC7O_04495 [Fimbriiglobus sp.]